MCLVFVSPLYAGDSDDEDGEDKPKKSSELVVLPIHKPAPYDFSQVPYDFSKPPTAHMHMPVADDFVLPGGMPDEVLLLILSYVWMNDFDALPNLRMTCKRLRNLTYDPGSWAQYLWHTFAAAEKEYRKDKITENTLIRLTFVTRILTHYEYYGFSKEWYESVCKILNRAFLNHPIIGFNHKAETVVRKGAEKKRAEPAVEEAQQDEDGFHDLEEVDLVDMLGFVIDPMGAIIKQGECSAREDAYHALRQVILQHMGVEWKIKGSLSDLCASSFSFDIGLGHIDINPQDPFTIIAFFEAILANLKLGTPGVNQEKIGAITVDLNTQTKWYLSKILSEYGRFISKWMARRYCKQWGVSLKGFQWQNPEHRIILMLLPADLQLRILQSMLPVKAEVLTERKKKKFKKQKKPVIAENTRHVWEEIFQHYNQQCQSANRLGMLQEEDCEQVVYEIDLPVLTFLVEGVFEVLKCKRVSREMKWHMGHLLLLYMQSKSATPEMLQEIINRANKLTKIPFSGDYADDDAYYGEGDDYLSWSIASCIHQFYLSHPNVVPAKAKRLLSKEGGIFKKNPDYYAAFVSNESVSVEEVRGVLKERLSDKVKANIYTAYLSRKTVDLDFVNDILIKAAKLKPRYALSILEAYIQSLHAQIDRIPELFLPYAKLLENEPDYSTAALLMRFFDACLDRDNLSPDFVSVIFNWVFKFQDVEFEMEYFNVCLIAPLLGPCLKHPNIDLETVECAMQQGGERLEEECDFYRAQNHHEGKGRPEILALIDRYFPVEEDGEGLDGELGDDEVDDDEDFE